MRNIPRRLGPTLTDYRLHVDAEPEAVDAVRLIVRPIRLPAERQTWAAYVRFLRYIQKKAANAAKALRFAEQNMGIVHAIPTDARTWYSLIGVDGAVARVYGSGRIFDASGKELRLER